MSRSKRSIDPATVRFHRVVSEGSLEDLQGALQLGFDLEAPGHCGITALMLALEMKDLARAELLLRHGADSEQTDDFNGTALKRAVDYDFVAGVRLLLSLGVDRGHQPRYPLKNVEFDFTTFDIPLPAEMQGIMSADEWRKSLEETTRSANEMGRSPKVEPVIRDVCSVEVLQLLVAAGEDLNLAPKEVKRELVGLRNDAELSVDAAEFRRNFLPRFGKRNPEPMDVPFWRDMIRTGGNAYSARKKFDGRSGSGPIWCFDRFGSTLTPLGDGRYVQIAGEHEDHYDPDFCIYNDVVVHDGRGDFTIFGYPSEVFPTTDFHTATLSGDGIYLIGGLGYPVQRRVGFTPVYRLTLETWRIEKVDTTGEMPGWIFHHRAMLDPARSVIRIDGGEVHTKDGDGETKLVGNKQSFELDLNRREWRRVD